MPKSLECQFCGCAEDRDGAGHHSAECVDTDRGTKPNPFKKRGGAVVVPEFQGCDLVKIKDDLWAAPNRLPTDVDEYHGTLCAKITQWLRENAKAIPANRVLADGMVGVDAGELSDLLHLVAVLSMDENGYERIEDLLKPIGDRREARDGIGWLGLMCNEMAELDALRRAKGEVEG